MNPLTRRIGSAGAWTAALVARPSGKASRLTSARQALPIMLALRVRSRVSPCSCMLQRLLYSRTTIADNALLYFLRRQSVYSSIYRSRRAGANIIVLRRQPEVVRLASAIGEDVRPAGGAGNVAVIAAWNNAGKIRSAASVVAGIRTC